MTNAEVFYCPICDRLAWNRESHVHDQDLRRSIDRTTDLRDDLIPVLLGVPADERADASTVADAIRDIQHHPPAVNAPLRHLDARAAIRTAQEHLQEIQDYELSHEELIRDLAIAQAALAEALTHLGER